MMQIYIKYSNNDENVYKKYSNDRVFPTVKSFILISAIPTTLFASFMEMTFALCFFADPLCQSYCPRRAYEPA